MLLKGINLHTQAFDDNQFYISINEVDGSYTLSVKNTIWLSSSDTFLQANGKLYTTGDGSLVLNSNI